MDHIRHSSLHAPFYAWPGDRQRTVLLQYHLRMEDRQVDQGHVHVLLRELRLLLVMVRRIVIDPFRSI